MSLPLILSLDVEELDEGLGLELHLRSKVLTESLDLLKQSLDLVIDLLLLHVLHGEVHVKLLDVPLSTSPIVLETFLSLPKNLILDLDGVAVL